jgi:hypothetical protein
MLKKIAEEITGLSKLLRTEVLPEIEKSAAGLLDHLDLVTNEVTLHYDNNKSVETLLVTYKHQSEAAQLVQNYILLSKGYEHLINCKATFSSLKYNYEIDGQSLNSILSESDEPRILATILN